MSVDTLVYQVANVLVLLVCGGYLVRTKVLPALKNSFATHEQQLEASRADRISLREKQAAYELAQENLIQKQKQIEQQLVLWQEMCAQKGLVRAEEIAVIEQCMQEKALIKSAYLARIQVYDVVCKRVVTDAREQLQALACTQEAKTYLADVVTFMKKAEQV